MRKSKKRCLIWSSAIADLLEEKKIIGGFSTQLNFWGDIFHDNNWEMHTLYNNKTIHKKSHYIFHKELNTTFLLSPLYWIFSLFLILEINPQLVITRGGKNRNILPIAIFCRIFKIKHIHFMGSDKDLTTEYINLKDKLNIILFKAGLKFVKHIVVQNDFQKGEVNKKISNRETLKIPNIWPSKQDNGKSKTEDLILWVGNIKSLKQPSLFIDIARKLPMYQFIMIGGNQDQVLYEKCCKYSETLSNFTFLGPIKFCQIDKYYKKAKILVCTSEYEGFPNTFLQMWSHNHPVISTVDPSNVITEFGLGCKCNNLNEFILKISSFMRNEKLYKKTQTNIELYFSKAHESQNHYERLLSFFDC